MLEHISKSLDQVMVDITVRCMLNPDNKDFYIGDLTLEKVKGMFVEMNDPDLDILTVFWKAYHIAETEYLKQQKEQKDLIEEYIKSHQKHTDCCPECGCPASLGYISGIKCPNCDYEGEE